MTLEEAEKNYANAKEAVKFAESLLLSAKAGLANAQDTLIEQLKLELDRLKGSKDGHGN